MDGRKIFILIFIYLFIFINVSIFVNVCKYVRRIDVVSKFQNSCVTTFTTVYLE